MDIACWLDQDTRIAYTVIQRKFVIVNELKEKNKNSDDKKKIIEGPTTSSNVAACANSLNRMYAAKLSIL